MDIVDQIRLERKRIQLREEVIFKYIAAHLLKDGVVSNEEFQKVTQKTTKQAQMDNLIDILIIKKSPAFHLFITSLVEDYPWIAEDLTSQIVSSRDIESFKQKNNKINSENDQNDNHISVVKAQGILNQKLI